MAKVKKGDIFSCNECGLIITVDEACGCAATELICCEEPMVKGKAAVAKAKAAKKPAVKKAAPKKAAAKKPAVKKASPKKVAAKKPAAKAKAVRR
jgi:hypothetical protein